VAANHEARKHAAHYEVNGKVINDPGSHLHWRTISTAGMILPSAGSSAER
jgi:hypothetical protein